MQVEELHQCRSYPDPAKKKLLEREVNYHVSLLKKANEALKKAINRHCADISSVSVQKKEIKPVQLDLSEVEEIVGTIKEGKESDEEYIQESNTESDYHPPSPVIPIVFSHVRDM